MSDWNAEISFLEPQYTERDNLDRGRRLTLRQIEATVVATKAGNSSARTTYELTFRVGDGGVVRLSKIERPDTENDTVHMHTLARSLAQAEAAVQEWCGNEDPANLAVRSTASYLREHAIDDVAPITNEAAVQEAETDD